MSHVDVDGRELEEGRMYRTELYAVHVFNGYDDLGRAMSLGEEETFPSEQTRTWKRVGNKADDSEEPGWRSNDLSP
tara:strand:- start:1117 stop:1344 length:228 start_codon:yes stop_codon:yes gene_type:complete